MRPYLILLLHGYTKLRKKLSVKIITSNRQLVIRGLNELVFRKLRHNTVKQNHTLKLPSRLFLEPNITCPYFCF